MRSPAPIGASRDASDDSDDATAPAGASWTLKWLMAMAGVVVVIVLTLVGFLSVTRGTPIRRIRAIGDSAAIPSVGDPAFRLTMGLYAGANLSAGHDVEVLANGDQTYPRLWADLRSARRLVEIQLYYSQPGAVADTLAVVLAERARHGVRVLLLLDAFGSQNLKGDWVDSLRSAGVEIALLRRMRWFKLDKLTRRSHVRAIAVDGRVGYTGGFGLADYWLGGGRAPGEWRETNARFTGPAVTQLEAAFAAAWAESTGDLIVGGPGSPQAEVSPTGSTWAAFMHTTPTLGSTAAERFLALSIAGARHTLYISNGYFLPDDDFRRLLREAAARGVDVRVITPSTKTDLKVVYFASRWRFAELLRAGVRIFEYQPAMMHAKTIVADGRWSAVGSMNFDNRSLALNDESTLLVLDSVVGATMDSLFLDDQRRSREITLGEFGRRPWWNRALEMAAAALSRVL